METIAGYFRWFRQAGGLRGAIRETQKEFSAVNRQQYRMKLKIERSLKKLQMEHAKNLMLAHMIEKKCHETREMMAAAYEGETKSPSDKIVQMETVMRSMMQDAEQQKNLQRDHQKRGETEATK